MPTKFESYHATITYKYDMERLIRKNGRATMMELMPREVIKWETTEKNWGRRTAV